MNAPSSIVPAAGWAQLLASLERDTVMVVGAPGTGKTCLARYLVSQLDRHLARVALIDGDLGRVSIGVPGCLGLALTGPWEAPAAQWFVGGTGAVGRRRRSVQGAGRLARRARAAGAEAIVLDTPGFEGDPEHLEILVDQALAVGVDRVVAIAPGGGGRDAKGQEDLLAALLERLGAGRTVHRLGASRCARRPTESEEREHRGSRLRAHFFGAGLRRFDAARLAAEEPAIPGDGNGGGNGHGNGRPRGDGRSNGRHPGGNGHRYGTGNGGGDALGRRAFVGRAVGLLDDSGYCLGLGRLEEAGPEEIAVVTPVRSDRVARLQLASFRLDADGTLL